jgi:hypothetical protein
MGVLIMKRVTSSLCRAVLILAVICLALSLSGCQKEVVQTREAGLLFYPALPNQPRLQYLRSYSGAEDFDVPQSSAFETFVLGESEIKLDQIVQPYGLDVYKGKIYVCDVGSGNIKVMDLNNNTFSEFHPGRLLQNPVNIIIEPDGTKYITDSTAGRIVVFNSDDKLVSYLGKQHDIKPIDMAIRGDRIYVTDIKNYQVIVMDKRTGKLIKKIGTSVEDDTKWSQDQFPFISDLAINRKGDLYVTDKIKSQVTRLTSEGEFTRTYGKLGSSPDSLVRPKGIAVDKKNRMWVVDSGPASAVKVFRNDGRLLMIFGFLGTDPGQMYMPAAIHIDYDNVDYFRKYAVDGAELEFLVFVTNQYGKQKVSVYGFGTFPPAESLIRLSNEVKPVIQEASGTTETTEKDSNQN